MQVMKPIRFAILLLLAGTLTACGAGKTPEPAQDANAIYTSVAGTMIANLNGQQTQTAQAIPPSPQPSPRPLDTFTPEPTLSILPSPTPQALLSTPGGALPPTISAVNGTPGSTAAGCIDSTFVSESEPADWTQFSKGQNFTKSWTFQNTGTCTWNNTISFAFQSGDRMGAKDVPLTISKTTGFVLVGQTKTFNVNFQAPRASGRYIGYWQMRDTTGGSFGSRVWIQIIVK